METAHIENVLDHNKNTDFMDTNTYFDGPLSGLDYLQYPPHSPFGVSMGCKNTACFPMHPIQLTYFSQCLPRRLPAVLARFPSLVA